jgi:threonine dehydrogenase-like Zn-dependent dehydrogenase
MTATTRAALLVAPRTIEMREFALPPIGDDEGLLRVEATGVCGVDWPAYTGLRIERFRPPIILGHEIVGRIVKIGKRAAQRWGVQEGDRVAMEEYAPCGRCDFCKSGHYYLCGGMQMQKMYGFTSLDVAPGLWGGFSEYVYLDPQALIHKLAESVPTAIAPLYIALSNGIRWVQSEAGIGIGDTVVILGPGQLGLACTIAAKEAGAGCIIVTGRSSDALKLSVARDLGAHHTIDVDAETDVVGRVMELTGGKLADAVINVASHAPAAARQAVELAKMRGVVVMAGGAGGPAEGFLPDLLVRKEITMRGVRGRTGRDLQKAIRLLESGKYPLQKLATHKFSIEDTERALLTIGGQGERGAIHVSVVPDLAAH